MRPPDLAYNLTNWLINMKVGIKTVPKPRLGSRGRPEESRAAILQAAVAEFSREGVAGARTDAIAHAAGVNKALLYYYFKDKDRLYAAVLDQVFGGLKRTIDEALSNQLPPREKLLAYVGAHFDYIASHPLYPRIVQGEMMRAAHGSAPQLARVAKQYFIPLFHKVAAVITGRSSLGRLSPGGSPALRSLHDCRNHFSFHQRAGPSYGRRHRSLFAGAGCRTPGGGAGFYFGSVVSTA